jgi:hypothetical protein
MEFVDGDGGGCMKLLEGEAGGYGDSSESIYELTVLVRAAFSSSW